MNTEIVTAVQSKNQRIKETRKATREKRKNQVCKTYEVKIDKSHANNTTLEHLNRLFLEAKWFYNHILSNVFDADYKTTQIPVKVKDEFEIRSIEDLSSQMRQGIIDRTIDNIRGLSKRKMNGGKIGKLKYKSVVKSILMRLDELQIM